MFLKNRKKRKVEFGFEQVIADTRAGDTYDVKEKPLSSIVFYGMVGFLALSVGIMFGRTYWLAVASHESLASRAEINSKKEIPVIAPRGIIFDRFGKALVENTPIFSVRLRLDEMVKTGEREKVFATLKSALGFSEAQFDEKIGTTDFEKQASIIIAKKISREQTIAIKDANLESLQIEEDYDRNYISEAFSHVIGYTAQTRESKTEVGQAGLEEMYDAQLQGVPGMKTYRRNALGQAETETAVVQPQIGTPLKTTIDGEFQQYFYDRFSQGLAELGRTNGGAIAINPQNGEVLALMSFPTFDANNVGKYLAAPNQPLFNRIVSGVYNPASTIKPIHGIAALHEGVIGPTDKILSTGSITIPNPYNPDFPSVFHDWAVQGWVDIRSAIARSSNVYFYEVIGGFENQKGVGIAKIQDYWKDFKFDQKTGIDVPHEAVGFLPNPEEKKNRTGISWKLGDSYNIAIGQGDFMLNPLALVRAHAAIANNGIAYVPHLNQEIAPTVGLDITKYAKEIKEVQQGMLDGVRQPYGTSHILADIPVAIYAKTGSAQVSNNEKTNAFFIGSMPAEKPEVLILILIENAKVGSVNTLPIAHDVMAWYYEHRIKTEKAK